MILILDDEYFVTELTKRKLSNVAVKCITANSIDEAKTIVSEKSDIELAIIDLHFPNGDGRDFANWLKSNYPETKRIAVTAHSYEIDKNKGDEDLFEQVLQKPVDFENDLLACINKYIKA